MPPYLAGRRQEYKEFERLLGQDVILENMVLTGLRGVGKTVLLETFKPRAIARGWLWAGTDMSESASVSEAALAARLLADLAIVTSSLMVEDPGDRPVGFGPAEAPRRVRLSYDILESVYHTTPGLVSDKLKAVLEFAWHYLSEQTSPRVIFAYDEAQNLSDDRARGEYPLSVLLDVFQSIQRKGIPFMLVLTGLPTLFAKLVEARTFAERMFRVVTVTRLSEADSRDAILQPISSARCPVTFSADSVDTICHESGGYPYFIQFICREVYDIFLQQFGSGSQAPVPVDPIQRKLDTDFFAGRWARVSDRQRDLLWVIANLRSSDEEFTIQEIVTTARTLLDKGFSPSQVSQMLVRLAEQGLVYKNRMGRYSFAVPLLGRFILRTYADARRLAP